jgi:hypothetical protein
VVGAPIEFTGPEQQGAIPLDLVPLGDGVAIATEHGGEAAEPLGHILLANPSGVQQDFWLGPQVASGVQIAAVGEDLLLAAFENAGPLRIERRTPDLELVWDLAGVATNARPRELLGGADPSIIYTFQTGSVPTQSEFLRFSADGELSSQSFRPRIEDIRRVELAANETATAGVVMQSSGLSPAEFWLFEEPAPRALLVLSDRLSNSDPAIAWTGDEWAVIYQESVVSGSIFELFVAFISADGATVNETVMVSEPGEHAVFPDIAAHPGGVTVVWQSGAVDGVLTRTIGLDHQLQDIVPASTEETAGALLPLITWTGERLVVAWASYTEELGYRGLVVFGEPVCP